jgi:hypothetical protein
MCIDEFVVGVVDRLLRRCGQIDFATRKSTARACDV